MEMWIGPIFMDPSYPSGFWSIRPARRGPHGRPSAPANRSPGVRRTSIEQP